LEPCEAICPLGQSPFGLWSTVGEPEIRVCDLGVENVTDPCESLPCLSAAGHPNVQEVDDACLQDIVPAGTRCEIQCERYYVFANTDNRLQTFECFDGTYEYGLKELKPDVAVDEDGNVIEDGDGDGDGDGEGDTSPIMASRGSFGTTYRCVLQRVPGLDPLVKVAAVAADLVMRMSVRDAAILLDNQKAVARATEFALTQQLSSKNSGYEVVVQLPLVQLSASRRLQIVLVLDNTTADVNGTNDTNLSDITTTTATTTPGEQTQIKCSFIIHGGKSGNATLIANDVAQLQQLDAAATLVDSINAMLIVEGLAVTVGSLTVSAPRKITYFIDNASGMTPAEYQRQQMLITVAISASTSVFVIFCLLCRKKLQDKLCGLCKKKRKESDDEYYDEKAAIVPGSKNSVFGAEVV